MRNLVKIIFIIITLIGITISCKPTKLTIPLYYYSPSKRGVFKGYTKYKEKKDINKLMATLKAYEDLGVLNLENDTLIEIYFYKMSNHKKNMTYLITNKAKYGIPDSAKWSEDSQYIKGATPLDVLLESEMKKNGSDWDFQRLLNAVVPWNSDTIDKLASNCVDIEGNTAIITRYIVKNGEIYDAVAYQFPTTDFWSTTPRPTRYFFIENNIRAQRYEDSINALKNGDSISR